MPDIKMRDVMRGTVKTIDKSVTAAQRMKDTYIRTKRKAENSVYSAEDSPSECTADRVSEGTETVLHETGHQLHREGQKAVNSTKKNISQAKSHFQRERMTDPLKKQKNTHFHRFTKRAVKTIEHSKKGVRQTAKGTSKAARRSVKTAEKTAKTTIKTSQQAAKATQRTAQTAAKVSHRAAQAARVAAKATVTALRAAVRATVSAVKAIIAATKALISALAAGGWIAVVVVVVICLIGLLAGSCFGIFFSGEDTGTGQTMRTAVQEINQEYEARLDAIKSSTRHDVLEMSCSRVEWCACFVSWCANECGYIDAGVIPKFAGCGTGVQWFKDRGLWQDRNYEPRPGDIIFFDWNDENGQDGDSDHVGIVEKVEDGVVYTVEGNSGDMCQENRYTEGYYEILGYGTPAY